MNLHWKVYRLSFGEHEIIEYDVFDHFTFAQEVEKLKKKKLLKDEFAEELRKIAAYYFWCKSEYEIILTSWPPYIDNKELTRLNASNKYLRYDVRLVSEKKVDIYQQLMMNWDRFVDYVYGGKL